MLVCPCHKLSRWVDKVTNAEVSSSESARKQYNGENLAGSGTF